MKLARRPRASMELPLKERPLQQREDDQERKDQAPLSPHSSPFAQPGEGRDAQDQNKDRKSNEAQHVKMVFGERSRDDRYIQAVKDKTPPRAMPVIRED